MKRPLGGSALVVLGLVLGGAHVVAAEARPVATVLTVKLKGDRDAYLQKVKAITTLSEKLQTGGKMRLWQATLAGSDTRLIYAVIEYANMEAMAKGVTKMQDSDEWKKLVKDVDQSGVRDVVSSQLIEEVTP